MVARASRERTQIGIQDQIEGRSVATVDPRMGFAVRDAHRPQLVVAVAALDLAAARERAPPEHAVQRCDPRGQRCVRAKTASLDRSFESDASVEIRAEPAKIERSGLQGESPGLVAGPPQTACAADAPVQRVRVDGIYREGISADQPRRLPGGRWYLRTGGLGLHLVGVRETPADAVGADGACDDRLARERPAQCRPLAAEREHR